MVSDEQRRALFDALVAGLGHGPATTMMQLLPPEGWSDVARRGDLHAMRAELRGEIGELRGQMGELRGEVRALDHRLSGDIRALDSRLSGEMAALRSRLDAQLAKLMAANAVTAAAVAGLVLGAVRLGGG